MIIKGKNVAYKLHGKIYHCAMDITMDYIGGKWKSVVLWYLKNGTHRFSELKKQMPDITEKMLSIQLRALEADGLIKRKVYGTQASRPGGIFSYRLRKNPNACIGCYCQMGKISRRK